MKSEDHPVGPGIEEQRVDVREQAVLKVVSLTFLREIVESPSVSEALPAMKEES